METRLDWICLRSFCLPFQFRTRAEKNSVGLNVPRDSRLNLRSHGSDVAGRNGGERRDLFGCDANLHSHLLPHQPTSVHNYFAKSLVYQSNMHHQTNHTLPRQQPRELRDRSTREPRQKVLARPLGFVKYTGMRLPSVFTASEIARWTVAEEHEPGRWRPARCCAINHREWRFRLRLAWRVFTGRYDALNWEEGSGELPNEHVNYRDCTSPDFILAGKEKESK